MPDDKAKRPFSLKHVFHTMGISFMVFFSLERFGAFLYFPFYIQWRTIYLSWPFVFTLLAPLSMLIQSYLYIYPKYNKKPLAGLIFAIVNIGVALASHLAICITGYNNSKLLSAISPAMAIDRLDCSTKSLVLILVVTFGIGILGLVYALKTYLKSKKDTPVVETPKTAAEAK